jgi:hypothetical protein
MEVFPTALHMRPDLAGYVSDMSLEAPIYAQRIR